MTWLERGDDVPCPVGVVEASADRPGGLLGRVVANVAVGDLVDIP